MTIYDVPVKEKDINKPHIVIVGSPLKGYKFYGPYPSWTSATLVAENYEPDVWVAKLVRNRG